MLERQRKRRQLVANLHHSGPDVIEELNFGHRLEAARRHADGASNDGGFGERAIEGALGAEFDLQPGGSFEDAALAFHLGQVGLSTAIGHVLAEHDDA